MIELVSHYLFPLLFLTGMVAGTIDAIAGGGGLIALPVLLSTGMSPAMALGTNKLQSMCGTAIAAHSYYRHGLIDPKKLLRGLIFCFGGAILGAIASQAISSELLKKIIPVLLFLVLLYSIFTPHVGHEDSAPKINEKWFYTIIGSLLGFYDGFLGPGVGAFWVFSFIFFLGYNLFKATAYTKIFNVTTNITAMICFAIGNNIDYRLGLCMAAGQIIGGKLGVHLAIKKGTRLIRPVFIIVVSITIGTLLYKTYA